MEAPKKIYLIRNFASNTSLNTTNNCHDKYLQEWYKSREKDADIEYIRTDVFIEKALEWIKEVIRPYYHEVRYKYEDFENYMKGE